MSRCSHPLVKLARAAVGLSRDEAARRAGIHPRFLRRIENGDSYAKVTPQIRAKIAEVLQTSEGVLFPEGEADR